jgi:hypothetical protein
VTVGDATRGRSGRADIAPAGRAWRIALAHRAAMETVTQDRASMAY